jgi:hypothetical protein
LEIVAIFINGRYGFTEERSVNKTAWIKLRALQAAGIVALALIVLTAFFGCFFMEGMAVMIS